MYLSKSNLIVTHVIFGSLLNYKPCHRELKHSRPIKKSDHIKVHLPQPHWPTYLMYVALLWALPIAHSYLSLDCIGNCVMCWLAIVDRHNITKRLDNGLFLKKEVAIFFWKKLQFYNCMWKTSRCTSWVLPINMESQNLRRIMLAWYLVPQNVTTELSVQAKCHFKSQSM